MLLVLVLVLEVMLLVLVLVLEVMLLEVLILVLLEEEDLIPVR